MNSDRKYECPLCGTDFTGAECHTSCALARGCTMVRCPHCAYEFVESGRITDMLRRWIRRAPPATTNSLADLPVGATAVITAITQTSGARLNRLASYGIVPGSELRLISKRPTIVIECGSATVALEDEIGREILVA